MYPEDNWAVNTTWVTLSWEPAIDTGSLVKWYHYEISNNSDFNSYFTGGYTSSLSADISWLTWSNPYYWRVYAEDNLWNTWEYSDVFNFELDFDAPIWWSVVINSWAATTDSALIDLSFTCAEDTHWTVKMAYWSVNRSTKWIAFQNTSG